MGTSTKMDKSHTAPISPIRTQGTPTHLPEHRIPSEKLPPCGKDDPGAREVADGSFVMDFDAKKCVELKRDICNLVQSIAEFIQETAIVREFEEAFTKHEVDVSTHCTNIMQVTPGMSDALRALDNLHQLPEGIARPTTKRKVMESILGALKQLLRAETESTPPLSPPRYYSSDEDYIEQSAPCAWKRERTESSPPSSPRAGHSSDDAVYDEPEPRACKKQRGEKKFWLPPQKKKKKKKKKS